MARPKLPLKRAQHRLTERVRALLHLAHGGNLAEASEATGIPYPTLRDLYVGRTVNPRAGTLDRLASTYGVSLEWFRTPEEPEEEPALGVRGYLPSAPSGGRSRPQLREILIPFAARPFYDVVSRLTARLEALPPDPDRPIVGEATGEALQFRLCTFLCQPLLAAERAGRAGVIPSFGEVEDRLASPIGQAWVRSLTALGRMWQLVLGELLGD